MIKVSFKESFPLLALEKRGSAHSKYGTVKLLIDKENRGVMCKMAETLSSQFLFLKKTGLQEKSVIQNTSSSEKETVIAEKNFPRKKKKEEKQVLNFGREVIVARGFFEIRKNGRKFLKEGKHISTTCIESTFLTVEREGTFEIKRGDHVLKKGIRRTANGRIEEGTFEWVEGEEFLEEGTLIEPSGVIYKGSFSLISPFKKTTYLTRGEMILPNGNIHRGEFQIGKDERSFFLRKGYKINCITGEKKEGIFSENDKLEQIFKGTISNRQFSFKGTLQDNEIKKGSFILSKLEEFSQSGSPLKLLNTSL